MRWSLLALICLVPLALGQHPQKLKGRYFKTKKIKGVEFARHGDQSLTLEFHLPQTDGPHPAILVVPGGAWRMRLRWSSYARAMAREGIAAVTMVHRTVPRDPHPAQIEDLRAAMQYLRLHAAAFGIDSERIAVAGVSSGGHLATLLALEDDRADPRASSALERMSTRPRCVLSYSGPMDLVWDPDIKVSRMQLRLVQDFLNLHWPPRDKATKESTNKIARAASPRFHATPDDPPVLLVHGVKDRIVPVDQARRMWTTLKELSPEHRLVLIPKANHVSYLAQWDGPLGWLPLGKRRKTPPWWAATREFLRRHLL